MFVWGDGSWRTGGSLGSRHVRAVANVRASEILPIFVCNPLLKAVKQLLGEVPWSMYPKDLVTATNGTIVMATDKRSMEYEIIIVNTVGRF